MTELTLCMIVRDEERWLSACLESVAGIVDRIVVVDTGSSDATRDIARAHGATVVEHEWADDFAAARNVALGEVHAGYLLVLDADERLAPGAGPALLEAVEAGALDCGLLPLHNAAHLEAAPAEVLSGDRRLGEPVRLGRLLRYTDDLAWEGRVHEHLTAWSARHPCRATVDADIVHYGAVPALRAELGKDQRNLRLLERRAADEPGSPSVAAYLAQEQARAGLVDAARTSASRAFELSLKAEGQGAIEAITHAGTIHALLELESGELDAAERALESAHARGVAHPNFAYLRGRVSERRAATCAPEPERDRHLSRAATGFAEALQSRGETTCVETLNGVTGFESAQRLGLVMLQRGDADSALEHFDAAIAERSECLDARLGRVEALLSKDLAREALDEVQPLLHPKLPDGWFLGAWAAALFGDCETAKALFLQIDLALAGRGWLAPHRGQLAGELRGMLNVA